MAKSTGKRITAKLAIRELKKLQLSRRAVQSTAASFGDWAVNSLASICDVASGALARIEHARLKDEARGGSTALFADMAVNDPRKRPKRK